MKDFTVIYIEVDTEDNTNTLQFSMPIYEFKHEINQIFN